MAGGGRRLQEATALRPAPGGGHPTPSEPPSKTLCESMGDMVNALCRLRRDFFNLDLHFLYPSLH